MRDMYRWTTYLAGLLLAGTWPTPAHADQIRDAQWHLTHLRISQAQQITKGDGITIGLLDTGVDASHPDLDGRILPGTNTSENTGDACTDPDGHGTAMAGLIAGQGSQGSGVLGIAPEAKILPVRVGSSKTSFNATPDIAEGIRWIINRNVAVISVSIAANDIAELETAVNAAREADIVVVAGVGNSPSSSFVRYPAGYEGVVAVAGVDRNSNHAPNSLTGDQVLISAPSTDIMSTDPGGKYSAGDGTSNATAIVAGVVALVRAKYPELTAPQVIERLTATATDRGAPGRDKEYGYGIVNPVAALSPDFRPSVSPTSASATNASSVRGDADGSSDTEAVRWPYVVGVIGCVVLVVTGTAMITVLVRRRRRSARHTGAGFTRHPAPPGAKGPRRRR